MDTCPSDSVLAAFVEHAGDADECTRIAAHLDRCEACRAAVGLAVAAT